MPLPTRNEAIAELNLLAWTLVGATSGNLDVRQTLDQLAHAAGVREVGTMHVIYELNGVEVDESWAQARVDGTGRHGDQIEAAARADHIRDVPDRDPRHRICQVVASQKFVSEEAVAILRHSAHATYVSFRNECTEANFGARIRYSDNVSGPLPTSAVVLPNCVHRPVHQVGISMPRDATDRPHPVSRSSSRENS